MEVALELGHTQIRKEIAEVMSHERVFGALLDLQFNKAGARQGFSDSAWMLLSEHDDAAVKFDGATKKEIANSIKFEMPSQHVLQCVEQQCLVCRRVLCMLGL